MNAQQEQPQYAIIAPQPAATAVSTALSVASTLAQSLNSSGEYVNMPSSYVTIGVTPPPPPSIQSISTTGNATSTFKTPLLPMPTLEDIEAAAQPSLIATSGGSLLLKYPTNNSRTSLIPLGMGATDLGPPPLEPVSNLSSSSNMTLININNTNIDGGSKLPATSTTVNSCHDNYTAPSGNATVPMTVTNSSRNTSRSNLNYKPASTKCCACFGLSSKRQHKPANMHPTKNILSTKSTTSHPKNTPYKRHHKHNTQTIWSAVLTNMGICALLLAYTLLGSFIFLTIESEDSQLVQQQRTLASTKRGVAWGYRGSDTTNIHNIYHHNVQQQQQQQQQNQLKQHFDNGTLVNAATSSLSSSNTSTLPLQQSSLPSSASSSSMLEGIYSINGNSNNNNNNNNNNNEFVYGDDATPQYALSPDTYDVRQRTIENIWDITVSLNILYKENWTKLAALEITKFQDQLIKRLNEDAFLQLPSEADVNSNSPATEAVLLYHQHAGLAHHLRHSHFYHEWNFAKAFFYSLTVITTIGYGNIAPRTTLGRLVTLAYAFFGIPLTLVYLSSTGGILAKVAREVFSKALCCCLCSNCGYCCYDEKRMADKERRMKRKRQEEELRKKQAAMQEPYYVRSGSMSDAYRTPEKQSLGNSNMHVPDLDSLSASESRGSMHGLAILAPILLCFSMMIIYILFGALVLYRLEEWPLLDGVYFCFMSLSTIGFGDMMPGFRRDSTTTIWFCSIYIMSGMALTAMCFNVIHEEIVNRIKIVVEFKKNTTLDTNNDDSGYYMPP